ncbi:hypothetical protein SAMN05192533_101218 [Mesobacillus persicus]|uniref:FAD/FMN-containing dehydrogenase n=1 Tax=Mesobacillus persicus TaxID=930146 RepID=A0A1H7W0R3_9BACI|nr:CUE domain-containing protein [Mesobacillus persicus]SEM15172.1 hypothetical protein SAMN05192533_101218 [Mesobacillus persicus]
MKKLMIGLMSIAFLLSAGTFALAQTDEIGEGSTNFKEMLPFMKEMHPDFSDEELQQMYISCHGNGNKAAPAVQTTNSLNKF